MRDKIKKMILLLIGYCVPFSFLAMYGDVTFGSMWLYVLLVLGYGLLCWLSIRFRSLSTLLLGNVISGGISAGCVAAFQTEKWSWYFKPFTPMTMVILISVVAFVVQLTIWLAINRKQLPKTSTGR